MILEHLLLPIDRHIFYWEGDTEQLHIFSRNQMDSTCHSLYNLTFPVLRSIWVYSLCVYFSFGGPIISNTLFFMSIGMYVFIIKITKNMRKLNQVIMRLAYIYFWLFRLWRLGLEDLIPRTRFFYIEMHVDGENWWNWCLVLIGCEGGWHKNYVGFMHDNKNIQLPWLNIFKNIY